MLLACLVQKLTEKAAINIFFKNLTIVDTNFNNSATDVLDTPSLDSLHG